MSSQVIPFTQQSVPAHIQRLFNTAAVAAENKTLQSGGIAVPKISFRGKVWRIVMDGNETVYTLPNSEDPSPSLEVVIVRGNPAKSKTYFAKKFVEGEDVMPTCASKDGSVPDVGVEAPQAVSCAVCPQNIWGSRTTDDGRKAKACGDSKRLAVLPAGDLNFAPLLLMVPPTSMSDNDNKENEARGWYALSQYAAWLSKQGVHYSAVVTKIAFDARPAHPKLLFKAVRYLDESEVARVMDVGASKEVTEILGMAAEPAPVKVPQIETAPAPAKKPSRPAAVKPAPAPEPEPETYVDPDLPVASPKKKTAAPAEPVATSKMEQQVSALLGDLGIGSDDTDD